MSRQTSGSTTGITSGSSSGVTSGGLSPALVVLSVLALLVGSTPGLAEDDDAAGGAPEVVVEKSEGDRPPGAGKGQGRGQRGGGRQNPRMEPDEVVSRMTEQLALDEKQQSQVRKIIEEQHAKGEAMRKEAQGSGDRTAIREKMQSMRTETHGKIDAVLTEEQRKKFAEIRSQRQGQRKEGRGQGRGHGRGQGFGEGRGGGRRGAPDAGAP